MYVSMEEIGEMKDRQGMASDGRNRRLLVVDDEPDIRLMLDLFFRTNGYQVVTAASAPEALNMARRQRFDLVISDIGMVGMDGYELARSLRSLQAYQAVPLIAITGFVEFADLDHALAAGFNERFTKPINLKELLETVKLFLEQSQNIL